MKRRLLYISLFALPALLASRFALQQRAERAALDAQITAARALQSQAKAQLAQIADAAKRNLAESGTPDGVSSAAEAALKALPPGERAIHRALQQIRERASNPAAHAAPRSPILKTWRPLMDFAPPLRPDFPELMDDPEYAAGAKEIARERVAWQYARLFRDLNLPPDKLAQLQDFLIEREMSFQDINGITEKASDLMRDARVATKQDWNKRVGAALGRDVILDLRRYDGTVRQYEAVEALGNLVSYTATPLQRDQEDKLYNAIVTALGPKKLAKVWVIPDEVMASATQYLSPPQIAALERLRAEQQVRVKQAAEQSAASSR
jgi:hypothetical protein